VQIVSKWMHGARAASIGSPLKPVILAIVLALAQAHSFVLAQDSGTEAWSFSMGSGLEMLYGTAYEYVYDNVNGNKMSELDWDIKPLLTLSSVARVKSGRIGLNLFCAAGFPGNTGNMTDSDWMNEGTAYPNVKTNYSESAAIAEHMTDLLISLSYDYPLSANLYLKPFVGFRYLNIAWQAKDGWLQYASNIANPSPPYNSYTTGAVYNLYGLLSTYEQTYSGFIIGLSADWKISSDISLTAGIQASPLVSSSAIDNHVLRGLAFTDKMSGGYLLEPDLAIDWSPREKISFMAHLKYSLISGLKGDETLTAGTNVNTASTGLNPGDSITYLNSAGAAYSAFGFGISAEWHL
jgi:outer membrane protease